MKSQRERNEEVYRPFSLDRVAVQQVEIILGNGLAHCGCHGSSVNAIQTRLIVKELIMGGYVYPN